MSDEERWIKTESIDFNKFNPNQMSPEKFAALRASIKQDGVQQPVILRKKGRRFEMIDGENRTKIARSLKINTLKAIIKDIDDQEAMRLCYKVNSDRGNIDVFKEAVFFDLLAQSGLKQKDTAKEYGVSDQFIKDRKKLLSINAEEKESLLKKISKNTELTGAHWLVYAKATSEARIEICKKIHKYNHLNVRDLKYKAESAADTITERKKFEAKVENAKIKVCPTCKGKPVKLDYKGNLQCDKWHDWHPIKGNTSQKIIGEKFSDKNKKKVKRYPRAVYTDIGYKDAAKITYDKILKSVAEIDSISFRDKKGINWEFNFRQGSLKLSKGTKQYSGPEYILYEMDGKKKIEIPRSELASKQNNEGAKEWLKWLGAKEVPRPKPKKKQKKQGGSK